MAISLVWSMEVISTLWANHLVLRGHPAPCCGVQMAAGLRIDLQTVADFCVAAAASTAPTLATEGRPHALTAIASLRPLVAVAFVRAHSSCVSMRVMEHGS